MQIKTTKQINARTQDGREVTADDAEVITIDDNDDGMVGLAKSLITSGQAEHYGDGGTVDDSADAELDQLRQEAEAAGVKVDGRWGADRLREEIASAGTGSEPDES